MASLKNILLAGVVALAASAGAAQAGTYGFTVTTGLTNSNNGFSTVKGATPFSGTPATASFTYTGALSFNNTAAQNTGNGGDLNSSFFASAGNVGPNFGISAASYSGAGSVSAANANYGTLGGFLAASGSVAGYQYASFYTIDLGILAAGTILTISHDDGASVYQGDVKIGSTTEGPTTVVTDKVTIGTTGSTKLYYSRQNGTPSILTVAVPEPVSLSLLGAGLVGLGLVRRRKARAA